jgi:hypothetical protein
MHGFQKLPHVRQFRIEGKIKIVGFVRQGDARLETQPACQRSGCQNAKPMPKTTMYVHN